MLKSLEINGFKSFAKQTKFEFSPEITAIVGPNGSGKSNIVEAIKWALGEQSFKDLRTKKSADLIYHGPLGFGNRLNRARVALVIENGEKNKDSFDEFIFSHEVWRDGESQYAVNGSQSRLKDVVEILTKLGLSQSQHFIINQGETAKILYVSPLERREIVEDALGLGVYRLKLNETERKLAETKRNVEKAGILRLELKPHLGFLEKQAKKFEKTNEIRETLKNIGKEFSAKEKNHLENRIKTLAEKEKPIQEELAKLEGAHRDFLQRIASANAKNAGEAEKIENELKKIYEKRAAIERDIGRLEGLLISSQKSASSQEEETVRKSEILNIILNIEKNIGTILELKTIEEIHKLANEILSIVRAFDLRIKKKQPDSQTLKDFAEKKDELEKSLGNIKNEEEKQRALLMKIKSVEEKDSEKLRNIEKDFLAAEEKRETLKNGINAVKFEKEKINFERAEYEREIESLNAFIKVAFDVENETVGFSYQNEEERLALKKELNRLKIRLEEAGGIDEGVLNEYREIKNRDDFLEKELNDLGEAETKLEKIIKELKQRISEEFESGLNSINSEFGQFFEIIFGGGKAKLFIENPPKQIMDGEPAEDAAAEQDAEPAKPGLSLDIALPRKRIKSLEMLSGGEKALVSLALLLAISSVNPPPFIVIDEADAALDETNSLRFAKLLKEISRKIQFIVITHNRQTMAASQSLYGVTMAKDGISRILSIKLEESKNFDNIENNVGN